MHSAHSEPRDERPRRRFGRTAAGVVIAAVLAACGAGSEDESPANNPGTGVGGGTGGGGGGTTTVTTPAPCTTAPASWAGVWTNMKASCTACHVQGGVAGGTRLLLVPAGTEIQNYNVVRDFAKVSGSLLLSKSIGMPSHAGGAPFVGNSSPQYQSLSGLITEAVAQVCVTTTTVPTPPPAAAGFWSEVAFASNANVLARASVLFAGRNPSDSELATSANMTGLRATIRTYMQGPVFDRFLNDVGDTHFLSPGVVVRGNNMGYDATDWPSAGAVLGGANVTQVDGATQTRFDSSARREPVELMRFIVRNDKPYTDIVMGNYTVMNGILAKYLGATVMGSFTNADDDTEWRQATLPSQRLGGTREHSGVLSTHPWLQRFPTTATNRNRHRVNVMFKQFLATDVSALAVRPLDDAANTFRIPTVENPKCAACHDTIDPIAAGFQNWNESNRYLPNRTSTGVDHALPASYRSANYPKDANNQAYYRVGDNWFRDEKEPGYGTTPMPGGVAGNKTALQWLGMQVANDPRFAIGAVHFWYEGVFGRAPLKAPSDPTNPQYAGLNAAYQAQSDELKAIADRFKGDQGHGTYNVKDLLVDLVTSKWFNAERVASMTAARSVELFDVGSLNLLPPSELNQKLIGIVGAGWTEFDNPYTGFGLNYGDFDGVQRINRAKETTMMQTASIDRLVAVRSCTYAKTDFDKAQAQRLLFPLVALSDTPNSGAAAISQQAQFLHKILWKEDVPTTDAEVQRTVKLFTDVWTDRATAPARPVNCIYNNNNDPNYTGRAWAAVLAYMLGDPKFLYE